jgi:AcrR family transcriptional regulator
MFDGLAVARPRIAEQRREEILAAFEACVVRNGIDNTTLDDVAKEVGQPRSLVRYFVGNRAEMVSLLIDRVLKRSQEQLKVLHSNGPDVRTRLVDFLFDELFAEPITGRLIAELWHLSARSEPIRVRLSEVYRHVVYEIAKQVSPTTRRGQDPAYLDTVLALFSLGLGASILRHFGLTATDPARFVQMVKGLADGQTTKHQTKRKARKTARV